MQIRKIKIPWTSNSAGAVSIPLTITGLITRVVIVPSATVAPTTLYDAVLTDESGVDVLAGGGANLSATVTKNFCPVFDVAGTANPGTQRFAVAGELTLAITNAGDTKQGTFWIYTETHDT